jgi:cytochrome-b5 reductase
MVDLITKKMDRSEYQPSSNSFIIFSKKIWKRKYKNFYMVAGGTGITPIYQIIQFITENELELSPNLTLLFANRTEDDILLQNELKEFEEKNPKVKVFYSVDKSIKENWNGFVGYIDEEKVAKSMGDFAKDIPNTVFLSCGPPILSNIVEKIWRTKYHV